MASMRKDLTETVAKILLIWDKAHGLQCSEKKKPPVEAAFRREDDGSRTHDPQNHNLML